MPNPYFRFKQFTVYHDRCAMKVGTDGVLLGVWTNIRNAGTALDIGTGTGLVALMLAQRNSHIVIDTIDIDSNAIEQATENVKQSPFSSQIRCYNITLQSFSERYTHKYDIIVSNPPYFTQSLKSPDKGRTLARHTDSLPMEELIRISSTLLTDSGRLSVIYPFEYKELLLAQAKESGLSASRITNVYPTPMAEPKRVLMELSKIETTAVENDLIIEQERHVYSEEFTALVKDFYLRL